MAPAARSHLAGPRLDRRRRPGPRPGGPGRPHGRGGPARVPRRGTPGPGDAAAGGADSPAAAGRRGHPADGGVAGAAHGDGRGLHAGAGDHRRRRARRRHRGRGQAIRAGARRPHGLRRAVPDLPRPLSAVRRGPARRHTAHAPCLHVPGGDRGPCDDRSRPAPGRAPPGLLDRIGPAAGTDHARRPERVAGRARRADRLAPRARHRPLGDRGDRCDLDAARLGAGGHRPREGPGGEPGRGLTMESATTTTRPVDGSAPSLPAPAERLPRRGPLWPRARAAAAHVGDYISLTKPRIIALLLVTTVATMFVADPAGPSLSVVLWTMLGGYLAAGGAGAINHYLDRERDARMARTLAAALAMAGLLGYVLVYTVWLKPLTPQNIVIGGAAGAVPPLVGWAAATGSLALDALYPFAIVFLWTPPHFWALALLIKDDYARTGVPMLPVVKGDEATRRQILAYAVVLTAFTALPFATGLLGAPYLVAALALGGGFIALAARLLRHPSRRAALRVYLASLAYLALLFCAMALDRAL